MGGTICRSRPDEQVSRSIISLPWYFVNRFLDSVRIAEEKLGHPPAIFEIFVTMEDTYGRQVNNIYELVAVLYSMLREDMIYADEHSYRYTLHRQEGYLTYSEIFHKRFP